MDQLAPAIAWVKRNVFWLGCGILLIACIVVWYLGTTSLAELQDENVQKIKNQIRMAQRVGKTTPVDLPEVMVHPNKTSLEGMDAELKETFDGLVEAWRMRVEAQKDLLVWPDLGEGQADSKVNERFEALFGRFNPAETFVSSAQDDQVAQGLLEIYEERINDHMIKLCGNDLLRTNWEWDPANSPNQEKTGGDPGDSGAGSGSDPGGFGSDSSGGGGFGGAGAGGATAPMGDDLGKYAVIWSDVNQELWRDKLTKFKTRDDHQKASTSPTALQCYMLQQDLWILEAMFKIIRGINGNSTANDLSLIKRIDHIAFGREAVKKLGELTQPDRALALGDGEEDADSGFNDLGMAGLDKGKGEVGGAVEQGYGSLEGTKVPPFHNRYVDLNLEPLDFRKVTEIIKGETIPDKHLELIVAKRVPVRIALKMDERRIADFMAACANSPFAFEIQQVRINKHEPGGEKIPLGGFGEESDKLSGMGTSIGDTELTSAGTDSQKIEVRTNYDVNVEFFGIVKIYNPVRPEILKKAAGFDSEPGTPNTNETAAAKAVARDPRS